VRLGVGLLVGALVSTSAVQPVEADGPGKARPGPRGLELRLRAPAGCPTVEALAGLVGEHLGEDAPAPSLRVDLAVRRDGVRWLARLEVRGAAGGRRDLRGATCREVIDAAALILALAIEGDGHVAGGEPLPIVLEGEPEVGGRAAREPFAGYLASRPAPAQRGASRRIPPPEPEPEPGRPEPGLDPALGADAAELRAGSAADRPRAEPGLDYDFDEGAVDPSSRTSAARGRRTRLSVRTGGAGESGTLPRAAAGLELAVSAWRGRNGVELSGALWPERAGRADGGPGARVGLWTAGARGCRAVAVIALCAGGELGRMAGRGMDLPGERAGAATWAALSGSVWVRRAIGRAALVGGVEGLVPVSRPRFELDDETLLYRPDPVAGRVMLGLELAIR
jgi:hypothetical protein